MKKIVLTGGGTGGHVTPHIALLPYLKNEYEIHYLGTNGIEKEIMNNFNYIKFHTIESVKFVRALTLKNLTIPFKLLKIKKEVILILKKIKPNIIFSKGGYVSIPVVLAAKSLKIPIVSHESDLSFGLANKIIYKRCNAMCTSFKETSSNKKKCIYTGPPIRESLFNGNKANAYKLTHLSPEKTTIIFVGGSTGAKPLNDFVFENIKTLSSKFNIIHLTGKGKQNLNIKCNGYYQSDFSTKLEDLLAISDIVVSRAGSNAIFEFLSLKKPMLLIPLPKGISRGDQIQNAQVFLKNNFAKVLSQDTLNLNNFLNSINEIIKNKNIIVKNMEEYKLLNSNKKIVDIINKYSK